jgi:hypothetical protein
MSGRTVVIAEDFDEHKSIRIIVLLVAIEARDEGLLNAFASVGFARGLEGVNAFRLHMDFNKMSSHGCSSIL